MRLIASLSLVFGSFLFCTISAYALADDGLRNVVTQLDKHDRVCATFQQKKFLKVLSRPLVSRGRLVFLRGAGIVWQVTDPYPAVVTLKKSSMTRWEAGKGQVLPYDRNPVFGALAGAFVAVMSGSFENLSESFEVDAKKNKNSGWTIVLKPHRGDLIRFISAIEISGEKSIHEIRIEEAGGDRTFITLSNVRHDGCELTDAEKTFFAK